MRIFISYASEQRDTAERLALGLQNVGNEIFFDRESLTPGTTFDDRIRTAIHRSSLFIFLISKESLRKGAYTLSELSMAEKQWPKPGGRILPVLLDETPIEELPAYVRAVSVVQAKGDPVADVLDSVARLRRERRNAHARVLVLAGLAILITIVGARIIFLKNVRLPTGSDGEQGLVSSTKKEPIVSDISATPMKKEEAQGGPKEYRFQATVNNATGEGITITDFVPETDNPKVYFAGSNEFHEFYPGETKPIWADYELRNETQSPSFKWKMCLGYVNSLELMTRKDLKGDEFDQFMARYRKELCSSWQSWGVNK